MKKILLVISLMLTVNMAYAIDITLKDVPEGAVENVKEMASVAVERYISGRDVKVAAEVKTKFESDIDTFRASNGLEKKYDRTGVVQ